MRRILVTGMAGFIGGAFYKMWKERFPKDIVYGLDNLTYASNLCTVQNFDHKTFHKVDLADKANLNLALASMDAGNLDFIFHFAAESHVCRSLEGPEKFLLSNTLGTFYLLEGLRQLKFKGRFCHVSTDEVKGELGATGKFTELTPDAPRSPYACSKANSDQWVRSYFSTYGMDVVITNCSNNFGPRQHEEKLIPRTISLIHANQPVTVYQSGLQIRDWIYVDDHCTAVIDVAFRGRSGETYMVGGNKEINNITIINTIHSLMNQVSDVDYNLNLEYTQSRPSDDFRYAIDTTKIERETGWRPDTSSFKGNLIKTIEWFLAKLK